MNTEQLKGTLTGHNKWRGCTEVQLCSNQRFIIQQVITEGNWNVILLGFSIEHVPQSYLALGVRELGYLYPLPFDIGRGLLPGR